MRQRTDTQTDTQTRVTTIQFASSTTHAKCNKVCHGWHGQPWLEEETESNTIRPLINQVDFSQFRNVGYMLDSQFSVDDPSRYSRIINCCRVCQTKIHVDLLVFLLYGQRISGLLFCTIRMYTSLRRPFSGPKYCDERVCVSVCLSARVSKKNTSKLLLSNLLHVLPVAVARSPSDDSAIYYVLPVSWMTSCLFIIGDAHPMPIGRIDLLKLTHQGAFSWTNNVL